jgi:hypothetical protein
MSDVPTPPSPTVPSSPPLLERSGANLSKAEQVAGLNALRRAGMSESRISEVISGQAKPPEAKPEPGPDTTRKAGPRLAEANQMAAALIQAGVDPARVKEAATADGYNVRQNQPDPRSEAEKEFDATGLVTPPSDPIRYPITWPDHSGGLAPDDPEIAAALGLNPLDEAGVRFSFQSAIRDGLVKMSLPAGIGGGLIEDAMSDAAVYSRLSDAAKAEWDRVQLHQFSQVFPDTDRARRDVATLLEGWQAERPALVNALLAKGWFRSARVQTQLALHASRLVRRGAMIEQRQKP